MYFGHKFFFFQILPFPMYVLHISAVVGWVLKILELYWWYFRSEAPTADGAETFCASPVCGPRGCANWKMKGSSYSKWMRILVFTFILTYTNLGFHKKAKSTSSAKNVTIEVDKIVVVVEVSTDTGPIAGYDPWKEIWENPYVPWPKLRWGVFWSWARVQSWGYVRITGVLGSYKTST